MTVTRIGRRLCSKFTAIYKIRTFDVMINLNRAHETFTLHTMSELP
jgi:hypothetical protein